MTVRLPSGHSDSGEENRRTNKPSLVLEAGALAYRHTDGGELLFLLVSKKRSKQWGIPKGKLKPHLSFAENAAREALEEAGAEGKISANSVGAFRDQKRGANRVGKRIIEVWVYLLEVTKCRSQWPEKGKRHIRWVPCDVAAVELREPVLVELCRRLSRPNH